MKKVMNILLIILVVLFGVYSVMSTLAMVERTRDYNEVVDKYSNVVDDYKLLYDKYSNTMNTTQVSQILIESVVHNISDVAECGIFNEVLYVCLPNFDDVKNKVEEHYQYISLLLEQYDYKSCVITVVDESGKCLYGWTLLSNGENYSFLSE